MKGITFRIPSQPWSDEDRTSIRALVTCSDTLLGYLSRTVERRLLVSLATAVLQDPELAKDDHATFHSMILLRSTVGLSDAQRVRWMELAAQRQELHRSDYWEIVWFLGRKGGVSDWAYDQYRVRFKVLQQESKVGRRVTANGIPGVVLSLEVRDGRTRWLIATETGERAFWSPPAKVSFGGRTGDP